MALMSTAAVESNLQDVAPGTVVWVRDAEWLVTQVAPTQDGLLVTCQGLSEHVAGTTAQFFQDLDKIEVADPRKTKVVADDSPG